MIPQLRESHLPRGAIAKIKVQERGQVLGAFLEHSG